MGAEPASRTRGRRLRHTLWPGLALTLAVLVLGVAAAGPAHADQGLQIDSSYLYRIDEAGAVRVQATFTLENTKPNRRSGNTITSYYFSGFSVFIPVGAEDIDVTDGTGPMAFELETLEQEGDLGPATLLSASFARNLRYRAATTMTVTYRLAGSEPRSTHIDRINPAYALFGAWGAADPGRLDVRVEIPPRYEVEVVGSPVSRRTLPEGTILEAVDIEDPDEFFLTIVARDDGALDSTSVLVGGSSINIHSWPGDNEWRSFVEGEVTAGVPLLEDLIGIRWPEEAGFDVFQSSEPEFAGYAGWYDGEANEIVIGEQLDRHTILHELSHAWFNTDLFESRWQGEALAEEFARLAEIELGTDPGRPAKPDPAVLRPGGLNRWTTSSLMEADEVWGYLTSAYVMAELSSEIGEEGLRTIIDGAASDRAAYQDRSGSMKFEQTDDWKRMLDLAQEAAGSEVAEDLFRDYVVSESDAKLLNTRSSARASLARIAQYGDSWFVPVGVIRAMNTWDFDVSEHRSSAATIALRDRDAFIDRLAELDRGIDPNPLVADAKAAYESAVDDYGPMAFAIDRRDRAIDALLSANDAASAPRSLSTTVGLRGEDIEADYARVLKLLAEDEPELASAAATDLIVKIDIAAEAGKATLTYAGLIAAAGLLTTIVIAVWVRRRARRKFRSRTGPDVERAWRSRAPQTIAHDRICLRSSSSPFSH